MAGFSFLDEYRLTGILLILGFVSFAIGASLPLLGEKGNFQIFTLPVREYLTVVAGNSVAWRWANVLMGTAVVVLVGGLTVLSTMLEGAGERALSRLGLVGMLLAAGLWLVFSAFRASVTVTAAEELAATGTLPTYYEPLGRWAFALFFSYAVIGFVALAVFGGSLLQVGFLPGWAGWATIAFSLAMLALLLVSGDTLPAFHYLPPLLIGVLLLVRA